MWSGPLRLPSLGRYCCGRWWKSGGRTEAGQSQGQISDLLVAWHSQRAASACELWDMTIAMPVVTISNKMWQVCFFLSFFFNPKRSLTNDRTWDQLRLPLSVFPNWGKPSREVFYQHLRLFWWQLLAWTSMADVPWCVRRQVYHMCVCIHTFIHIYNYYIHIHIHNTYLYVWSCLSVSVSVSPLSPSVSVRSSRAEAVNTCLRVCLGYV